MGFGKKLTLMFLSNERLTLKSFLSLSSTKDAIFCLSIKKGKIAMRIKKTVKIKKENFKNRSTVN